MKLTTVHVTNYRSVEDSGEFSIDDVTCLVGKNEAGKTAILTALASLNPHPATPVPLDRERDYPRRYLTAYQARHPETEARVIRTRWLLDADEVEAIEAEFGSGALKAEAVVVDRHYGGEPTWTIDINFNGIADFLQTKFKLDAAERAPLKGKIYTQHITGALEALASRTAKQQQVLDYLKSIGSVTARVTSILSQYLPTFMYFSNYDRMDGAVQVEEVRSLTSKGQIDQEQYRGKKLFSDFFDYAGVPLEDVVSETTYETFNARLQSASTNITNQVLEYWTQNPHLDVQIKIEAARSGDPAPLNTGTIARARIYNQLHRVDTPFSERSAGFVWFFSFLVKFAQVRDEDVPVVLVLDEPGLSLHGKAQGDLLRYFDEQLRPYHQIVYSTHSPFMVSPDSLLQARIVEDRVEFKGNRPTPIGTKVSEDVLSRDPDTLFPLQGALGYEITQTLFVGKNTLLLEGPSDVLYLKVLAQALAKLGRTGLSPSWTLCPVGGIGNIRSFVGLFAGSNLNIAVLTDFAQGAKKEVERVRALEVLRQGRVLTIDQFVGKSEADTEDLFEEDLFIQIVNGAYGLKGNAQISKKKLNAEGMVSERVVENVEKFFNLKVPLEVAEFDHYRPAEYLMMNPGLLDPADTRVLQTRSCGASFR